MNGQLPPGWRITELSPDDLRIVQHVKSIRQIVEKLEAIPRLKKQIPSQWRGKPIEYLNQEERDAFHFSLQDESTKRALLAQKERPAHEDIDHLLRPLADCVANPDAKNLDELTSKRSLDPQEITSHRLTTQGRNQLGQSTGSSAPPERRERGIEAFTYSEPTLLSDDDLKRFKKLVRTDAIVASEPSPPTQKPKRSWWSRLFNEPDEARRLTEEEFNDYIGKN